MSSCCRYVNVYARPQTSLSSCKIVPRARGLAIYVIGRPTSPGYLLIASFVFVTQDPVMKSQQVFFGNIAELRFAHAVDVARHALAGAIVVNDDLQKIGDRGYSPQVLLRAINWAE